MGAGKRGFMSYFPAIGSSYRQIETKTTVKVIDLDIVRRQVAVQYRSKETGDVKHNNVNLTSFIEAFERVSYGKQGQGKTSKDRDKG